MASLYNDTRKKRGGVWKTLFFLFLILVTARASAPYLLKGWLENKLEDQGHTARIDDVDLNLWRGAYEAEGIRISKEGAPNEVLFSALKLDLSVDWSHALRGEWVGEIVIDQPVIAIDARQKKSEIDWQERLQSMFPLRINEFRVQKGVLRYQTGQADLVLENLYVRANNLTNVESLARKRHATALFTADIAEKGRLRARLDLNPFAPSPTFELNAGIRDTTLASLAAILREQANLDVEAGLIDLEIEATAEDGRYSGTVRPTFEGLEAFRWKEEGKASELFGKLREGLPDGVEKALEGRRLGEYKVSATLAKDQDIESAVLQVLVDSFSRAVVPEIEGFLHERLKSGKGS